MWHLKVFGRIKIHPKKFVVVVALAFAFAVLATLAVLAAVKPQAKVIVASQKLSVAESLVIEFSFPPARRYLRPSIEPETPGNWYWRGGIFGRLSRTLVFEPDNYWLPEQKYTVIIDGVAGVTALESKTRQEDSFTTAALPKLTPPPSLENQPVGIEELIFKLDQPNPNIVDFSFIFTPPVEYGLSYDESALEYVVRPVGGLKQAESYSYQIIRERLVYSRSSESVTSRAEKEVIWQGSFTTRAPTAIAQYSPQGIDVIPEQVESIEINFTQPMVQEDLTGSISISPPLEGFWQWQGESRLVYSIQGKLAKATQYEITISRAEAVSGDRLAQPVTMTFTTIGQIRLKSYQPSSSGSSRDSEIAVTFNQPVDRLSAEKRFSINPAVEGSFSWQGDTLKFKSTRPLDYAKTYKVRITPGVISLYGYNLESELSFSFTTEEKVVVLNIAIDKQDRPLSCEAAALKMALAYRGVLVSEGDIMNYVGYDPTQKSGNSWGDPDVGFVGNIDGSQNSTGYGVHWGPIAKAAGVWRSAVAISGWSVSQAAAEIEANNPVIVWGVLGNAYYDPWYTPSGRKVDAWKGEHARVVIGYKGSVENPTSFIINDPIAGRITWSAKKFLNNWQTFNNSGVVVY